MRDRDAARDQEAELLRMRLHQLVDDVEPRGDALPGLLSATRRRRLPARRRPLLAAGGAAVAATAVFLVALLVFPGGSNRGTEPVSVQPNSYVAESEAGVVSSFDVFSGQRIERVGRVSGAIDGPLAADGQRVYAVVARGDRYEVVEVSGDQRVISPLAAAGARRTVLAAGGGRVAYLDGDGVEISGAGEQRRVPVPPGQEVLDLALAADGHLAVLTATGIEPPGAPGAAAAPVEPLTADRLSIHVVDPRAVSMTERAELRTPGECGPVALAWAGRELAAVQPVDCAFTRVRITRLDRDSGEQIGAGVPFEAGMLRAGQVQLSTDRLERFLLTASGPRQWLVDGAHVLPVPPVCSSPSTCGGAPGSFWG